MAPPVAAKPQGFLLKMRLVAPDGTPFSGKSYRVQWGPKTVPQPPGDGSTISSIVYLTLAAPPAMAQNTAWQAINKAINATLNMEMVAAADYPTKVNVVIAGNELPDFIYNPTTTVPVGVIAGLPALLKAKCADLTPYLSGDAVNEYPNLSHYTSPTWRIGVIDGKIYGIPSARPPIGGVMMYRMSEDDSIEYISDAWAAYALEERILDELIHREITDPVAVLLSDGTTAFYVATGEIV